MVKRMHQEWPRIFAIEIVKFGTLFLFNSPIAQGDGSTTKIVTYVMQTQDERTQTRWTLTEWLRIKERMKLMDVWLTMFSNPGKDSFKPELNVSAVKTKANFQKKVDGIMTDRGQGDGLYLKSQLWLTNLVSSKVGIRTLNIDIGVEASHRDTGDMNLHTESDQITTLNTTTRRGDKESAQTNSYSVNLRLFGKHIQDSSLVIKYGFMETKNSLYFPQAVGSFDREANPSMSLAAGRMKGAEFQIYLTNTLGIETTGHQYMATTMAYGDHTLEGTYGEGLLFVDVGCVRLQAGIYEERWYGRWQTTKTSTRESGYVGGFKLQF